MNYSQVTIHGHDREAEDRRELVQGVSSHDNTTEEGTKWPVGEYILCGEEREPDDVELIGHSQVQDVDVGDGLHFGITQHHIDGQSVADQTHQEDCEGDDCCHQSAAALKWDALSGHVGGNVEEARVGEEEGRGNNSRRVQV